MEAEQENRRLLFCNLKYEPDSNDGIGVEQISINTAVQTECHSSMFEEK